MGGPSRKLALKPSAIFWCRDLRPRSLRKCLAARVDQSAPPAGKIHFPALLWSLDHGGLYGRQRACSSGRSSGPSACSESSASAYDHPSRSRSKSMLFCSCMTFRSPPANDDVAVCRICATLRTRPPPHTAESRPSTKVGPGSVIFSGSADGWPSARVEQKNGRIGASSRRRRTAVA